MGRAGTGRVGARLRSLTACVLCCEAIAPEMRRQGRGRIVNIAATAGRYRSAYARPEGVTGTARRSAATSGGVLALTRELSLELGPRWRHGQRGRARMDPHRAVHAGVGADVRARARRDILAEIFAGPARTMPGECRRGLFWPRTRAATCRERPSTSMAAGGCHEARGAGDHRRRAGRWASGKRLPRPVPARELAYRLVRYRRFPPSPRRRRRSARSSLRAEPAGGRDGRRAGGRHGRDRVEDLGTRRHPRQQCRGRDRSEGLTETRDDEWDAVVNLNPKGQFLCCREVAAPMRRQAWGASSIIASNAGRYRKQYGLRRPRVQRGEGESSSSPGRGA